MPDLLIRWACDADGSIVSPNEATAGGSYFCPACKSRLSVKGTKETYQKCQHFLHRINIACAPETVIHKTAKLREQGAVNEWKRSSGRPPIVNH
jgi:hypothetical protein